MGVSPAGLIPSYLELLQCKVAVMMMMLLMTRTMMMMLLLMKRTMMMKVVVVMMTMTSMIMVSPTGLNLFYLEHLG